MSGSTYQQLGANETRVLKLEPAKNYGDDIVCSLVHISLDHPPGYEALSYVWKNSSYPWTESYKWPKEKLHSAIYNKDTKETLFIDLTFEELRDAPFEELRRMYYQMGGPKPEGYIICDGEQLTIGAELNEALRRIRLEDRKRMIWIDALCINQQDIQERNEHVQRMGEIYAKAERVLIWLGEYISDAVEAMEVLGTLCEKIGTFIEQTKYLARGLIRTRFLADPVIKSLRWDMLSDLINRNWFRRVWILQEVVNAKKATIYAANSAIDWDAFAAVLSWLRDNDVDSPLYVTGEIASINTILMIKRLSDLKRDPVQQQLPRLLDVLKDSRACKSTLPIDKVYGVLGITSEDEVFRLCGEFDYNLSASEVFTRIAVSEISKENGLEVLYLCTKSPNESDVKAPSWVPDWTQPCHHDSLSSLKYQSAAAGGSKPNFRIDQTTLVSCGRIFDTVQAVELSRRIPKGAKVAEYSQEALKGENFWERPEQKYKEYFANATIASREWLTNTMSIAFPDNAMTKEAYDNLWRTFCCNRTDGGKVPPAEFAEYFSAFVTLMTQPKETMDSMSYKERYEVSLRCTRFMDSFGVWCYNRRFYRSERGRFGWAPDQARPGDKLCVLNGLSVPVILRPDESGNFEVFGDVYVHGVMDGEVMLTDIEEQDIRIV